jgi:nitrogen fixation NifU-like protein
VTVYLILDDDEIVDIAFEGHGCAISKASASMMTLGVKGKTSAEAQELFEEVHEMLAGDGMDTPDAERLGRLTALAGVRDYPTRVKCATLAWHTFKGALEGEERVVFSE